jgi:hypothetical protein
MLKENSRNTVLHTPKYRLKRLFFDKRTGAIFNSLQELPEKREIDFEALYFYLLIGFVPGNTTLLKDIICLPGGCEIEIKHNNWEILKRFSLIDNLNFQKYSEYSEKELIDIGGEIFVNSVNTLYNKGKQNIVPLSGGYDSRAILAALLEFSDAKDIITYTFGSPGTYEYEIGNKIGKLAGTQHFSFDLTKIPITQEKLYQTVKVTDGNTNIMQPVFLLDILKQFDQNAIYWSGFTGDGVGGSHYKRNGDTVLKEAKSNFISSECTGLISRKDESATNDLLENESIYNGVLNTEEDLFFTNHVERYTVNHLFFSNYTYMNPYMEDSFIEFIMGLSNGYREQKYLYNEIMKRRFPLLFQYPTKIDLATRPLHRVYNKAVKSSLFIPLIKKTTNYVDYRILLKSNYYNLLISNLQGLSDKGILQDFNIDAEKMVREHVGNKKDHSNRLSLLISLNTIIDVFGVL